MESYTIGFYSKGQCVEKNIKHVAVQVTKHKRSKRGIIENNSITK